MGKKLGSAHRQTHNNGGISKIQRKQLKNIKWSKLEQLGQQNQMVSDYNPKYKVSTVCLIELDGSINKLMED